MSKKVTAFVLLLAFALLCGCGKAELSVPEGWDHEAEAEKTVNQYYSCKTAEDFRAVMVSGISDRALDSLIQYNAGYDESLNLGPMVVRDLKFVGSDGSYHVFLVRATYEADTDESDTQTANTEIIWTLPGVLTNVVYSSQVMLLTIEDGRYVVADMSGFAEQLVLNRYSLCNCDLGKTAVYSDSCESCEGTGFTTIEEETPVEEPLEEIEVFTQEDNMLQFEGDISLHSYTVTSKVAPCPDCDGQGYKTVTFVDCTECDGKGYFKH